MTEAIVVLVTAGSEEEARTLARTLVSERLVACANVLPGVRSIYHWEGKVADDAEHLLVLKTRRTLFGEVERRVRELHSYDVPEVIACEIVEGSPAYLAWLLAETSGR